MNTPSDSIGLPSPELDQLRRRQQRAERRARLSWACALTALALTILLNVRPAALAQSPGVSLASLVARVTALETKTAPLTTTGSASAGYLMTITKANVQIVDGSGSTSDGTYDLDGNPTGTGKLTGMGNLIIGYNAAGNQNGDVRTGSHNLIVGDQNSYSSFGGLVAGQSNTVSGIYAAASGGFANTASGGNASVSGGAFDVASGGAASISGGLDNKASYYEASVSGGYFNTASGQLSSASGGFANTASGTASSVTGGYHDTASNSYASVSGGYYTTASGSASSVSGGSGVINSNSTGWSGGSYHSP